MDKKQINFFAQYRLQEKVRHKLSRQARIGIIVLVVQVIIIAGICAISTLRIGDMEKTIAEINALYDTEKVSAYTSNKEAARDLELQSEQLVMIRDDIHKYPKIDSALIETIVLVMPEKVTLEEIGYEDAQLQLNITSATEVDFATFIHELRNLEIFTDVEYSGYDNENGEYVGTAILQLKGGSYEDIS